MDDNKEKDLIIQEGSEESTAEPAAQLDTSVPEAEYEPVAADAPVDADFTEEAEPESPAQTVSLYEPIGGEPPKKEKRAKREKKEKKPLTWRRMTLPIIGIAVASFLAGIFFTVFVIAPFVSAAEFLEEGGVPSIIQPDFDEFTKEEAGTEKEKDAYTQHPDKLPKIGGKAPVITDTMNPVPEIVEELSDGVVMVTASITRSYEDGSEQSEGVSVGSGFVISEDGYIVTNNHVIDHGNSYLVTFADGTEYSAKLVGTDTETDIAVIKIEPTHKLKLMPIGDSDKVRTGEISIAIGNARGSGETLAGTVTVGYISAAERELMFNGSRQVFIQTDTAVNSGNSGGPLLNNKGEVIGVVTLKSLISSITQEGEVVNSEGLGFAIPINRAMEKVQQIILSGDIKKPGIGITYIEVTEEEAELNDIPRGFMIFEFINESPCEEAGMKLDDIIVKADGINIYEIESIADYISERGIGGTIRFTVYRDGEYLEFDVVIKDLNAIR